MAGVVRETAPCVLLCAELPALARPPTHAFPLHDVKPAGACVQFGISPPGVISVALNSSKPQRIRENVELVSTAVPAEFWIAAKDAGLIDKNYPYLG